VERTDVTDRLFDGAILSVGALRNTVTFAGGDTATFEGLGVVRALPGQPPVTIIDGGSNIEFWELIRINSVSLTLADSPNTPIPSAFPTTTQPQPGDTPDNDQTFPIVLPGNIPGLLMPAPVIILIPRPSDLGRRPVPVLFPTSISPARREVMPQMWLTPEGIQVGTGGQDDPVRVTPGDTITNITNITQIQDFRQRNHPPVVTCNAEPPPAPDCCDCEEIRQIVIEELDSKFPPKRPFSLQTVLLPASNSRTFVLPPFTRYVNLTIVVPPPNVRSQFGGALGQEVFYNGWYSFGATTSSNERVPIHYNFVSVPIPPGVTQFTYTVYLGGTASVTIGYSVEA